MTYRQYVNRVRKLSAVYVPPVGCIRSHVIPVSWCGKHRDVVSPEIAAHETNIYFSHYQPNLQDGARITPLAVKHMRHVMPIIDPGNAEWWIDKAWFHEGRIITNGVE